MNSLGLNFNGVSGNKIYNHTAMTLFGKGQLSRSLNTTDFATEFSNEDLSNSNEVSTRYLEDGGYLYLKEKPGNSDDRTVTPDDNFRLVFAGNTVGQGDITGAFSGVGVQNTATIDRFTNTIRLGYLSQKHEVDIITSKSSVDKKVPTDMVRLASLVRTAYEQGKVGLTISPRTLINWARKQL